MKSILIFVAFVSCYPSWAQRIVPRTESIVVTGKIKNPLVFPLADLDTFQSVPIQDRIIYNHKGEVKDTLTGLSGIPLKNLLSKIQFVYEKPKNLNEFYLSFIASDGYKVVFSWNEIYNTEAGNKFFIITEMEGKKLKDLAQRILFISTSDLESGRRYIKGLQKIEVRQIE